MAMRLTGKRALVAVAAGLALAGAPAFALTAAPAPALAAGTQGRAVTVEHNSKASAWLADPDDCLKESLEDQTVGDITLNADGNWNPASGIEIVTVDRDLTIHGRNTDKDYINDIQFIVTPGHTLTLDNVNLYTRPLDTDYSRTVVEVQGGGKLVTTGTGDIVSNGGNTEAVAIWLDRNGTAELNATPSGFSWGADYAGVAGSSYAVRAETGSTLTITNGRFHEENGRGEAIWSKGRVIIDPADNAGFKAKPGELSDTNFGTIKMDASEDGKAVLVAKKTQFGINKGNGTRENANVDGNITLVGGAKAYLTDSVSSSDTIDSSAGKDSISAISVDKSSVVYSQDNNWESDLQTLSTESDLPGFSAFKSSYEGDHFTKNQYYAEATNESINNTVEGTTQLFKIADGQSFSDLESQVTAKADGLKTETTPNEDGNTAAAKAELPLGKSDIYGKYEIAHNFEATGITGEGHVYEISAVHELQAGWDVSSYRSGDTYTAPAGDGTTTSGVEGDVAPAGYVFAGWYTKGGDLRTGDADNKWQHDPIIPNAPAQSDDPASKHALPADQKTGYAYAKFIPASFLTAKAQKETVEAGKSYNVRFLSAVDGYNYKSIQYKIEETDAQGKVQQRQPVLGGTTTKAYDYLTADGKKAYAPNYFNISGDANGKYASFFTRWVVQDVKADFKGGWKVTVSLVTPDGTTVEGTAPRTVLTSQFPN